MARQYEDLTGKRFGRLYVKSYALTKNGRRYWSCLCECGRETIVPTAKLNNGHTQSCGCLNKDLTKQANTKHGLSHSRLNNIHAHMKRRCNNENCKSYEWYGARGITYTSEWEEFESFARWALSNGYNDNLTLERIDVNGHYEPSNCTWIPLDEQSLNRRISKNNKTGYPGVFYNEKYGKYQVTGKVNGKQKYLGLFSDRYEAIRKKRKFEMKEFGKYLYEIEKEKQYILKFDNGQYLYNCDLGMTDESLACKLTQSEIEGIDPRLMQFAVEVE